MDLRVARPLSIGAGAVVVDEGRVLLVRNIYGLTRGRYLLPAGRVRQGELPDQAAVRETFEETGLQVEIDGLIGVRLWVLDDGEHNYFFMFKARLLSPASDLRPNPGEIDDARFFTSAEMDTLTGDETWAGAIAVAINVSISLSSDSRGLSLRRNRCLVDLTQDGFYIRKRVDLGRVLTIYLLLTNPEVERLIPQTRWTAPN